MSLELSKGECTPSYIRTVRISCGDDGVVLLQGLEGSHKYTEVAELTHRLQRCRLILIDSYSNFHSSLVLVFLLL